MRGQKTRRISSRPLLDPITTTTTLTKKSPFLVRIALDGQMITKLFFHVATRRTRPANQPSRDTELYQHHLPDRYSGPGSTRRSSIPFHQLDTISLLINSISVAHPLKTSNSSLLWIYLSVHFQQLPGYWNEKIIKPTNDDGQPNYPWNFQSG